MKKIIALSILAMTSVSFGQSFSPISGMKFKCFDDVSGYTYILKILDIGDEDGEIKMFRHGKFVKKYSNVEFDEHSEGSMFFYDNGITQEKFSIHFPYNKLEEAYYMDGGDSRALDCQIIKR